MFEAIFMSQETSRCIRVSFCRETENFRCNVAWLDNVARKNGPFVRSERVNRYDNKNTTAGRFFLLEAKSSSVLRSDLRSRAARTVSAKKISIYHVSHPRPASWLIPNLSRSARWNREETWLWVRNLQDSKNVSSESRNIHIFACIQKKKSPPGLIDFTGY